MYVYDGEVGRGAVEGAGEVLGRYWGGAGEVWRGAGEVL